jgi:F-type H+-transporting ATPase subunit gamma
VFYNAFINAIAAEQASKMNAMEGATKNAGEMLDTLTLKYNKARQAKVTTELVEIVSGASALDG